MFPGACLELNRNLTALRQEDDGPVLCKLGRGSILTIAGIMSASGLVETTCAGAVYELFADDLEDAARTTDAPEKYVAAAAV
jgi:hypothetical protein